jgi:hypothetical protein
LAAVALGSVGCAKSRAEDEAKERERMAQEETKRHLEEKQRELQKKREELMRSAEVYGSPPPPLLDGGMDAGTKSGKPCKCNPGDPLCDCF